MLQRIEWMQKSSRCVSRLRHSCGDSIFHYELYIYIFFFFQRIINQTRESNEKLGAQIKSAQDERNQLLKKIEESDNSRWNRDKYCFIQPLRHNQKRKQSRTVLALTSGIILTILRVAKNVNRTTLHENLKYHKTRRYAMVRGEVDKLGALHVG